MKVLRFAIGGKGLRRTTDPVSARFRRLVVPMRISEVGLHAPEASEDFLTVVAFIRPRIGL